MRWLPKAIPVLVAIIAMDFMLVFGFEAWRILSSPLLGLEQPAFARMIYGIGSIFGLQATEHVPVAAFLGFANLMIATLFAVHLASRMRAMRAGLISHDTLDAALILVVITTIFAATPAILQGATEILVQQRLPLWLVGLAATLSMVERLPEARRAGPGFWERLMLRLFVCRDDGRLSVAPVVRDELPAVRWNSLRADAGMVMQRGEVKGEGPWFTLRGR